MSWFKDFPYAYASADATPLYIIALNDYVSESGDVAFARENWDSLWKAYQFLRSTYDAQGFPQNFGVGHGWVEGGPLLPVKTEFYQSGLGVEALRALSNLAHLTGKDDVSRQLATEDFERAEAIAEPGILVTGEKDLRLCAGSRQPARRRTQCAGDGSDVVRLCPTPTCRRHDHATRRARPRDRLGHAHHFLSRGEVRRRRISLRLSVAAVYRMGIGRRIPLSSGAAGVFESARQRVAGAGWIARARHRSSFRRLLSAAFDQFAAPDLVRGHGHQSDFARTVWAGNGRGKPSDYAGPACASRLDFVCHSQCACRIRQRRLSISRKTSDRIVLEIKRMGSGDCCVEFSPAFSLRTQVTSVEMNGRPMPFKLQPHGQDQHLPLRLVGPRRLHHIGDSGQE